MKSYLSRKIFFVVLMYAAVLVVAAEAANQGQVRFIDRAEYADRLRALWLGECIANWTGLQTEGVRTRAPFFIDEAWHMFGFVVNQNPWPADDDTDIEYVYCHLLHQHQTTMLSAQQIRDGWMTHINGWIWVSNAEARSLMNGGHTTPQTGMLALNRRALMIDAQLTTEIFGALAPGMPGMALQMADLPIRTTATGYAAHAAQYFVLLYSLASNVNPNMSRAKQIIWLADEARKYIPDTSKTADIYDFVKADYLANPDKDDWESTRDKIYFRYHRLASSYGFRYQAWYESSVNFATTIMALLYGEGDYRKTVRIGTLSGWDSDCSTATVGGLLGLIYGYDELRTQFSRSWFSDRYWISRTRDNMPDYLPADPAEDTFTMLANRMLEIIDMAVREAGGTVDSRNNRWLLPRTTSGTPLEQNPLYREMQRSANNRVHQLGGTVTPESSVPVSSYIEKMADGFEHNFAGEEWWRTREPWFYSTYQGSGHSGEIQTLGVTYDQLVDVSVIRYIEGASNSGGGWFTSANVEVKIDGLWQSPPSSVIASEALNPNQDYQIIDYILSEPVEATGIRITGPVGGSNGYVTALELDAFASFAYAPPVARDDNYIAFQDMVLSVGAEWGVLANDITYGGVLTAILVSGPSNGSLSLNSDGSFEYIPDAGFMGMDSFTYKTNDGEEESNVATVYIQVVSRPLAWWNFDEDSGTIAYDSVGENHGTLVNGPVWTTGQFGGALSFDGINDYVDVAHSPDFDIGTGFAVALWFKANPTQFNPDTLFAVIDKSHRSTESPPYWSGWVMQGDVGSGRLWFGIGNGADFQGVGTNNNILDDVWHHIVGIFDGSNIKLYLDAVFQGSIVFSGTPVNNTGPLNIGRWATGATRNFNGLIDEVRIYKQALSAAEIQQLYLHPPHFDLGNVVGLEIVGPEEVAENFSASYKAIAHYDNSSTRDVTDSAEWSVEPNSIASIEAGLLQTKDVNMPRDIITISAQYAEGGVTVEDERQVSVFAICPSGSALEFDGVNDYVSIPPLNFYSNTVTISAWIKRDGEQNWWTGLVYCTRNDGATWDGSVCIAGLSLGDEAYWIGQPSSLNHLAYHWDTDVGWQWRSGLFVPDGEWTFAAVVVEPNQATMYMMPAGGDLYSAVNYQHHIETTFDQRWTIGKDERGDWGGNRCFDGQIDDVRIYNRALTAEEIRANMHTRLTGEEPNLIGYWDFDEGEGQIVYDLSGNGNHGLLHSGPLWVDSNAPIGICGIEVSMHFTPQVLNASSEGRWLKAHFVLPEGFVVEDVDVNTPAKIWPLGIESDYINVFINKDGLVEIEIGFDRVAFCSAGIDYGPAEVMVVGRFADGEYFYGSDIIRIINNNLKYLAVLASHWLEAGCGVPDWCGGVDLDRNSVVDFVDFVLLDGCCIKVVKK